MLRDVTAMKTKLLVAIFQKTQEPGAIILPNCSEFLLHLDHQVPTFSCKFLKLSDNIFPPVTIDIQFNRA